jgi:hypothetical protein
MPDTSDTKAALAASDLPFLTAYARRNEVLVVFGCLYELRGRLLA